MAITITTRSGFLSHFFLIISLPVTSVGTVARLMLLVLHLEAFKGSSTPVPLQVIDAQQSVPQASVPKGSHV